MVGMHLHLSRTESLIHFWRAMFDDLPMSLLKARRHCLRASYEQVIEEKANCLQRLMNSR